MWRLWEALGMAVVPDVAALGGVPDVAALAANQVLACLLRAAAASLYLSVAPVVGGGRAGVVPDDSLDSVCGQLPLQRVA
jgi:hypothetical protein